jgi:hypothetical protein
MTDLERKLAEALREQAGEVTPNLDAAWAEQQRRQRRPQRRRRASVWIAPLAAVLVVLTSVLVVTRLNTAAPAPAPPANPGQELRLAKPEYRSLTELNRFDAPVFLTDFVGQTDTWTAYAFLGYAVAAPEPSLFCVAAVPKGTALERGVPQYGIKSPVCVPISVGTVRAGYVGESLGPLPPGRAVYLVDPEAGTLRLFDANGDLSLAKKFGKLVSGQVFLADVKPGSPPVRFDVSSTPAPPASR